MLSKMHTAEIHGSSKKDRMGAEKQKLACILEDNTLMEGVDKIDQLAANHRAVHKSLIWYKKLSLYLLDLTVVNCYCVYLVSGRHPSFLDFAHSSSKNFSLTNPSRSTNLGAILHCPTIPTSLAATSP